MARSQLPRAPKGIQSVSKALELLCCFTSNQPEWGVTEIAQYLGLCKSGAYRLLATCEQYGFVDRTAAHRYRLGVRTLELGSVYRFDRRLLCKAEVVLRSLAEATQSIAHLAELDGREVLELLRSGSPRAIQFTPRPQIRMPVHATALGKVLLAAGGDELFQRLAGQYRTLRRYTPNTITDPERLKRELETVVEQGYGFSDQEACIGCRCIAVPVRGTSRQVVAALSISNSVEKFSDRDVPFLLGKVLSTAAWIERGL
jgi:DNA-binding IclR family transcriptional regulator